MSAGAPAALGDMVGDVHLDPGDLEHLPADLTDHVGPSQVGSASTAAHGWVHDYLVGNAPGQMRPWGAGLLALAPTGRSARRASLGPRLTRSHGVLRRRLRRVLRVTSQLGFESRYKIAQRFIFRPQLFGLRAQLLGEQLQGCDLLSQLLIGGLIIEGRTVVGWNSQRYARRFPWWRMASSEDLTDYEFPIGDGS
jgi:hypothetical protein